MASAAGALLSGSKAEASPQEAEANKEVVRNTTQGKLQNVSQRTAAVQKSAPLSPGGTGENWLNTKLGVDTTDKYFSSTHFWASYMNSLVENSKQIAISIYGFIRAPYPFNIAAGTYLFTLSFQLAVDAYKFAWISNTIEYKYNLIKETEIKNYKK